MLSKETLEQYRRMTPSQRLELTVFLCKNAWRSLEEGDPKIVARRFLRLEQENQLRNERMVAGLVRAEKQNEAKNS
jgi:hypothetical protein